MKQSYSGGSNKYYSNGTKYESKNSLPQCPKCKKVLPKYERCSCEGSYDSNYPSLSSKPVATLPLRTTDPPKTAWRKKEENPIDSSPSLRSSAPIYYPTNRTHHSVKRTNSFPTEPTCFEETLVGRVHYVKLVKYSSQGLEVVFLDTSKESLPNILHESFLQKETLKFPNENREVFGTLQWSAFSRMIQSMSLDERIQFCSSRVPVGSTFNVYVNSFDPEYGIILTLAMKPSPLLSAPPSQIEPGKSKFRYLIVVDLEATCDYSPQPQIDYTNSEIIEFPWVVIDTTTMESIYEKQLYIKPESVQSITPYCRVLTGITEETVQSACNLQEAILIFNEYFRTYPEGSCQILTDGVWDLLQLNQEAKRKEIKLDPWFQQYFNLREEFRKFLPIFPFKPHEPPLQVMLQALSRKFVGKHHSGIDDCHSIVQVVKEMLKRGHSFVEPIPIADQEDPGFLRFAAVAPYGSWKCKLCTEKFCKPGECELGRAVWNKPQARVCRFCLTGYTDAVDQSGKYAPKV